MKLEFCVACGLKDGLQDGHLLKGGAMLKLIGSPYVQVVMTSCINSATACIAASMNKGTFIKHEIVPDGGSFEVRFSDGRPSVFFFWDDLPSRRLNPETLDRVTALEKAKAVARAASVG